MSFVLPYNPTIIVEYFTNLFSLDLTTLSSYETTILTLLSNIYFFVFWAVIIYFSLKIFNRIWERFF